MLRPTLVYTEAKKEKATLVLMADQSRSMSVRDGLNGQSRWDLLRSTLDNVAPAVRKLGREIEIQGYTFDAEIHPADVKRAN